MSGARCRLLGHDVAMETDPGLLTSSRINRAGKTIRKYLRGEIQDRAKFQEALGVLIAFRAQHQRPLTTANMGLRSMVKTAGCANPEVSQRLKRIPTIVNKLWREPTLALANMQDLGGCRAVLDSVDEMGSVLDRIQGRRRVESVSDYVTRPRDSGYRGIHVIVRYSDRRIEVQLRTRVMHEWAVTVETLSNVMGLDVKSGQGPQQVQDLMRVISHAMALEEAGQRVDSGTIGEMQRLREVATPYLVGGRK